MSCIGWFCHLCRVKCADSLMGGMQVLSCSINDAIYPALPRQGTCQCTKEILCYEDLHCPPSTIHCHACWTLRFPYWSTWSLWGACNGFNGLALAVFFLGWTKQYWCHMMLVSKLVDIPLFPLSILYPASSWVLDISWHGWTCCCPKYLIVAKYLGYSTSYPPVPTYWSRDAGHRNMGTSSDCLLTVFLSILQVRSGPGDIARACTKRWWIMWVSSFSYVWDRHSWDLLPHVLQLSPVLPSGYFSGLDPIWFSLIQWW